MRSIMLGLGHHPSRRRMGSVRQIVSRMPEPSSAERQLSCVLVPLAWKDLSALGMRSLGGGR